MGFMKEIYSGDRAGLLVAFGGDTPTANYTPTDSVEEALEYFNLYVKDGIIYIKTEADAIYDELGLENQNEIHELREAVDAIAATLNDEAAISYQIFYPEWNGNGIEYEVGQRVRYNQDFFKVLQAHTSQSTWNPIDAPSLFASLLTSDDGEVLDWVQPNSTNPYMTGDRVRFEGAIYESLIDNNTWSPAAYPAGWSLIEE